MSSTANIYIKQAADFSVDIELFDTDGDDYVTSGLTFYADLKRLYSTTKLASFGISVSQNDITLSLDSSITETLKPGKYQYDVLMQEPSGNISKILEGLAIVESTITRIP